MKFTSDMVMAALKARHSEDVFVPECKDGPSVGSFSRMDAWVMPRSWAHPDVTCYEVKVSRQDFVGDNKWMNYLPCCNYMYFATAPGIVKDGELPAEVGHLELSKTGNRLFLRKKAARREANTEQLNQVMRYILMWRANVGRDKEVSGSLGASHWEGILAEKAEKRRYGHMLGRRIGQMYREEVAKVQAENVRLTGLHSVYESIRRCIQRVGLDPETCSEWRFDDRLSELLNGGHKEVVGDVNRAINSLTALKSELEKIVKPGGAT